MFYFYLLNFQAKGKDGSGNESNLSLSQSSIALPDGELSDSMSISGKLGQKGGDFDRRQKKKLVKILYFLKSNRYCIYTILLLTEKEITVRNF